MQPSRGTVVDRAAAALARDARAFTPANLFHAVRREGAVGRRVAPTLEVFTEGALRETLRQGPLRGLLQHGGRLRPSNRLAAEYRAYFPAAILVFDRAELVDLAVANGLPTQGRIAVVSLDGYPANVVRWICAGIRAGHGAPVGYLHDAATVVYPFAYEPLATLAREGRRGGFSYVDLGLPPGGLPWSRLPFGPKSPRGPPVQWLEEPPPSAILGFAARRLLRLLPPDPWLRPLGPSPAQESAP